MVIRTSNESNFRTSAYEAITSYVTHAPADVIPVVQQVTVSILTRMEQLLHMHSQLLGADDRNNWNELQGNLCSVVIVSNSNSCVLFHEVICALGCCSQTWRWH